MIIEIEFDNDKDALNRDKHGLPLEFAALLFEGDYKEQTDDRQNYGERRMIAMGDINGHLYVCVYTWRKNKRRVISLRKANRREVNAYNKNKFPQSRSETEEI